ncbi:hypothetical protein [Mesorhizobium huakuii]|uniref:Uncharacterized protein n=1 Tax=Mesorhizobium huakuii TaxID=28104 RepID=A0A7G6T119_9HYPH|nr:hypothetical protein [Mesorhizobium huakuii]QND60451.1 hypothetical protein HB778_30815 [Mesorhizobium huakuii]
MGFLFGGKIWLAAEVFIGIGTGLLLGWWARGMAETSSESLVDDSVSDWDLEPPLNASSRQSVRLFRNEPNGLPPWFLDLQDLHKGDRTD